MPRRVFASLLLKISGNVNADIGIGTRIPLKKIITWNQEIKPFISARCVRRCIRERLYEKGFKIDPLAMIGPATAQQLGDIGNPIEYVDDDLFGFLVPKEKGLTVKRISPIKTSHLISLRHAEIKVDFAGRFPREFIENYQKGFPAPFEVEVAEWIGKLNIIVSDRVGKFYEDELMEDLKQHSQLIKEDGIYSLPVEERIKRLRGLLEILLMEGWTFPRSAHSPSVPEFYYSVISLTESFIPLFGFIDITNEGKINLDLLNNFKKTYKNLIDELILIDYRKSRYIDYRYSKSKKGENSEEINEEELTSEKVNEIISSICNYIIIAR